MNDLKEYKFDTYAKASIELDGSCKLQLMEWKQIFAQNLFSLSQNTIILTLDASP